MESSKYETLNGKASAETRIQDQHKKSSFMKISSYFTALRPWSLSASLMPTLLGSAIAYKYSNNADFNYLTFILTIFTVLCVHGAGNLVNTYYDFKKGIDDRKSDDRILVDHILTIDEVTTLGGLLYLMGSIGFALLILISPARLEHLALVYFGGLSSSFLYTGGIGLKYIALGRLEWATIYYAIPLALNAEAILHSNNTRDSEDDKKAGIVTLAILIGRTASHVLYAFFLFTPYIMFAVISMKYSKWFLLPLVTLPNAFKIEKQFRANKLHLVPKKTAKLNLCLGILYVLACTFTKQLPYISAT
ncbi:UbiA prenyltransferase family [Popillia japonica]|uniref:UbiA prenyltransferase family n=1 Tax=Popillia japonica TaxID=7064 RepID=A0AAW1KID5_POPJA